MPVRVEMHFAVGTFISEAHLVMDLEWDPNLEITVPSSQRVELTGGFRGGRGRGGFGGGGPGMGFPGGGMQVRMVTTWTDYQWDLTFDRDFSRAGVSAHSQNSPERPPVFCRRGPFRRDPYSPARRGESRRPGQDRKPG